MLAIAPTFLLLLPAVLHYTVYASHGKDGQCHANYVKRDLQDTLMTSTMQRRSPLVVAPGQSVPGSGIKSWPLTRSEGDNDVVHMLPRSLNAFSGHSQAVSHDKHLQLWPLHYIRKRSIEQVNSPFLRRGLGASSLDAESAGEMHLQRRIGGSIHDIPALVHLRELREGKFHKVSPGSLMSKHTLIKRSPQEAPPGGAGGGGDVMPSKPLGHKHKHKHHHKHHHDKHKHKERHHIKGHHGHHGKHHKTGGGGAGAAGGETTGAPTIPEGAAVDPSAAGGAVADAGTADQSMAAADAGGAVAAPAA